MGIGGLTLPSISAITEPSKFQLSLGTAYAGKTSKDHGIMSAIQYPGGRGTLFANGMDPLRHSINDVVLRTGLLAPDPESDMVATPSGQRAVATLDLDVSLDGAYNPSNNEQIVVAGYVIIFVSSLNPTSGSCQVLIGATASDTLDNLQDLIEGDTDNFGLTYSHPPFWIDYSSIIEVTSKTDTTLALRIKKYGSEGNKTLAYLSWGSWTDCEFPDSGMGAVGATDYFAGGADGTGDNPSVGEYLYVPGFYREEDGATSGIGDEAEASLGVDGETSLSSLPDPVDDDDIDYKRWWRTLNGGAVFYHGRDVADTGSTDTDDISNTDIAKHIVYDSSIHRSWEAGHVARCRYLTHYKGRWVGGGVIRAAVYSAGTADVENGSNQVVLSGGYPTKEMEHRVFRTTGGTDDDALEYYIVAVDEASRKLYLHIPFEGTTVTGSSGGSSYEIADVRDPFRLYFSEPLLPNQTSASMEIDGVQGPDPEGITGLYSIFESVIIFTKTGIWRLTGNDPLSFHLTHEYEGVGCVSGHSIVGMENALYWMAQDGIYAWTGAGEPIKVSAPPAGGKPTGIQRTIDSINQAHAHGIIGHYDPEERLLRWFVPLGDDITNRNAIVFDLDVKAWALDDCEDITYAATVAARDGSLHTLVGDLYGHVWELDVSTTDGAFGFAPVQTVQSGPTLNSFSVSGTPLPTAGDGLSGVPVLLVDANGDAVRARVASNTSSTVTLAEYLEATPSAGTRAIFGGIHQHIESGRFTLGVPQDRKILEAVKVCFAKSDEGRFWFSYAVDQEDPVVTSSMGGDPTKDDGEEHFWCRNWGRRLKIRLDSFTPGGGAAFQHLESWIRVRDP